MNVDDIQRWLSLASNPRAAYKIGSRKYLLEVQKGSVFTWIFDEDPETGEPSSLSVYLTPRETKKLIKAGHGNGALEAVRGNMSCSVGVVSVGDRFSFIEVPNKDQSESFFVEKLMHAADTAETAETFSLGVEPEESRERMKIDLMATTHFAMATA